MNKKDILDKIKSLDGLNNEERAYLVNLVNTKKKYGLVWEEKIEEVEEQLRTKLPILKEVKERAIINNTESKKTPNHILIEGDNLHALTSLVFTHENRIDTMYFDPPYNTGNKSWKYNNDYVEKDDAFRHSKWLEFMSKRLKIAKKLLKTEGIIVVTIDDYEVATLTLLLDEIFGESNRLGTLIIENNPRGRTTNKFLATCHEYALIYGKDASLASFNMLKLTEDQAGAFKFKDEVGNYRLLPFRRSGGLSTPTDRPNSEFPLIYSKVKNEIIAVGGKNNLDPKTGYDSDKIIHLNPAGDAIESDKESYLKSLDNTELLEIFPLDSKGKRRVWRWSDRKKILEAAKAGEFVVTSKGNILSVQLKDRIKSGRKAKSIWVNAKYDASSHGTVLIDEILSQRNSFDYPKSLHAVVDTLNLIENRTVNKPIILDIFGGSGTTMHAVMKMNEEDKGSRQCILVTNNENHIAEEVTYERNKRVIRGYTNAQGNHVPGLENNNLRYYQCDFVDREPSLTNKRQLTQLATELLCIKEDCYEEVTSHLNKENWNKLFTNGSGQFVYVVYDDLYIEEAVEALTQFVQKEIPESKIKVYVFANGQYAYAEEFEDIAENITLAALPDAIYKAYQNILPKENKEFVPVLKEDVDVEPEMDFE